jgi:predicted AlkP superfamily phosphohydrolase/phosphomutase
MTGRRPPLVILGLDVGDADAIERWAGEGHLPTIAGLMERGAWGRTAGPETVCEYGIGTALFSGVSRADHGYYYFRQLALGTYDMKKVRPPNEEAPPFWSHLSASGERVLIVDAPDTRLVRGLPGVQIVNWATHHGARYPAEAEPPEVLETAPRRPFGKRLVHPDPNSTLENDLGLYHLLLDRTRQQGGLFRQLLSRGPFDVTAVFFSETHAATHLFWKYRPEGEGSYPETHPLRHGIRDVYQAVDSEMRQFLDLLPAEANVFFVTLYGMQDEHPTSTLIESFLEALGYHAIGAAPGSGGGGRKARDPMSLARRLVPEGLRTAISRRLPEDIQERLLASRLRDTTDWSRTTAFAIPSLFTSFVRVNLRGREPRGIVAPGAEYDALLARIEEDLGQLVDADTGLPAVREVSRATTLFGDGPPQSLPDLFVEWVPGPRMLGTVRHPRATLVQEKPAFYMDSQEKLTGFVAGAGPGLARSGPLGDVDLLDLAPTFLALLGHPTPGTMRGRPLASLLAE